MFTPKLDVLICCAAKDISKLPYCAGGARKVQGLQRIVVVCPQSSVSEARNLCGTDNVEYHSDEEFEFNKFHWPHPWIKQQHIKLLQTFTGDVYATIDADTVLLSPNPFPFFDGEKPIFWIGEPEAGVFPHAPYFRYNHAMMGIGMVTNHTFIGDMNLFDRSKITELIRACGCRGKTEFVAKSLSVHTDDCYIAEPEFYGTFMAHRHPNGFVIRRLRQYPINGRHQPDESTQLYKPDEIESAIRYASGLGLNTIAFHSWAPRLGISQPSGNIP